ncbi:MAG: hypothetical protein EXS44_00890 [Candidatus Levybacteria bacterium]|nr:hypothetical protein [Candidatus Levybacteria bacterium]
MKILFLLGYPPKFEATNWKEIGKYSKTYPAFDKNFYQLVKALEHSREFEKEITKSRERLKIPADGYSWREYEKMSDYKRKDQSEAEIQKMLFLIKNYPNEVARIARVLGLGNRITDSLKEIILTSTVTSPDYLSDIHYWLEPDDSYAFMDKDEIEEAKEVTKSFNIAFTRQVTKNELLKFIENNWSEINRRIQKLPKKTNNYISERDLRIVDLRENSKLPFSEIVNQISKEFRPDDPFGRINEDSIKTAYRRAKLKIRSIANSSKKTNSS